MFFVSTSFISFTFIKFFDLHVWSVQQYRAQMGLKFINSQQQGDHHSEKCFTAAHA